MNASYKNFIRKTILVLLLFYIIENANSQIYDLIVTSTGDSIACCIDSVTETHVYFEMKVKNNWIQTNTNLNKVIVYQLKSVNKESIRFKQGTSYILPFDENKARLTNNLNLNALGNASLLSLQYEVLFFKKPNNFLALGFGFGFNEDYVQTKRYFTIPIHVTWNKGRKEKHFLEVGLGCTLINSSTENFFLYPIIGYRMQPKKFNSIIFGPYLSYPLGLTPLDIFDADDILFICVGMRFGYSF